MCRHVPKVPYGSYAPGLGISLGPNSTPITPRREHLLIFRNCSVFGLVLDVPLDIRLSAGEKIGKVGISYNPLQLV